MNKLVLVTFCLLGLTYAGFPAEHQFFNWMKEHNMRFQSNEIVHRFECFLETLENIEENRRLNPLATFGLNEFSHLCKDEFAAMYLGYKASDEVVDFPKYESTSEERGAVPDSWDWTTKGATTPIKNQGQCGSCWAFSTTEGTESGYFMTNKQLKVLAPQQIVDCSTKDLGCNGGWLKWAFKYVEANGLEAESSYPYHAKNQHCQYDSSKVVVRINGAKEAGVGNEDEMKTASYTHGPLSVCVDASSWSSYTGGILTHCGKTIDHCVQAVGWGSQGQTKYWKVRNSWGASWGEKGYINLEFGKNICGIDQDPFYAF